MEGQDAHASQECEERRRWGGFLLCPTSAFFGVGVRGLFCNISIDTLRGDHLLTRQLSL